MIHKILNDRDICNVNTNITKNTSHVTIQFIDDSTNIISFKNDNIIKPYLEEYYKLLYDCYTANKLKINPDKTQYLIICKNSIKNNFKNFSIKADKYIIKPSNTIKILGT